MTVYEPTNHALVRIRQRVELKYAKGKVTMEDAKAWLNSSMQYAKLTKIDEEGRRHYKFKNYNIICVGCKVVTVSYYKDASREIIEDLQDILTKRVDKELKPLKRQYRETAIKMHEAEIKRLKSYNPKSIESITREINTLRDELSIMEHKIEDFEALINRFKNNGRLEE